VQKIVKKLNLKDETNDLEFWLTKSYQERLAALEVLREHYVKYFLNGHRPGFQRVYRVIK
jgi:hypothetical protein